ncbi:Helix-turn-helix domain-containing protein [Paenibacillus sp. UNCCL117]|uniref:helix-turn-helix transcriptional regulator n=1 Tax=unclassified Paenibacillus TaxID=185978 RepID=UPI000881FE0F|nr:MULTISPECIES: helix-turn-helix domain-containing protein [unclassified Paenibacillus]SDD51055.1 Helix-turn-helix domain-containing protein [Paenibacillus sp. cl123]SFW49605.1 Helix-turn-helix domain-containing protein [Paenibacillus sp. UNCCL117]
MSFRQTLSKIMSGLRLKEYTSSLFIRLLLGFTVVISFMVSFIWYSVVFYRGSLEEEVINHNTLNLQKTSENYDRLIDSIHSSILTFSLELEGTQDEVIDYSHAVSTMKKIRLLVSNRALYLDNLLLLSKDSGFAIEKGRGSDIETMFRRYYASPDYSVAFWQDQFSQPDKFRLLPESVFAERDDFGWTEEKKLLPIIMRNEGLPNFYLLAMVDADHMYKELGQSVNDYFYILNEQGQPIYNSSKRADIAFPKFPGPSGHVMKDNVYYFYKKGENGLTYVHLLPDRSISGQVRWNFSFVLLLVLTITFSVIVSLLISVRLNTPVKRIIHAIQMWNVPLTLESGIKEFNIIHDKINDILQTNRDIHQDMSNKESLLRYYAYSNMLKKIRFQDGSDLARVTEDRSFVLLLVQVSYKSKLSLLNVQEERATSFIREYVNRIIAQTYADSITFQMEMDQIVSIVFTDKNDPRIAQTLEQVHHMLETESEYCFFTLTASGGTEDWNEAYQTGLSQLKRRKFGCETQVVTADGTQDEDAGLSQAQEEELDANLYSGNAAPALQLVRRVLGKMSKRGQSAQSVLHFAESVVLRTQKSLQQRQIEPEPARVALADLQSCYTYEYLDEILSSMMERSSKLVRETVEKRDHIIDFVYDYLEQHYDKDITLDSIADKLNISRGYLSRYFKEKTGEYFVDYVNSVRINKAKKLLLHPDIRIQDAAQSVGYQNINSFNRMFKKLTGITPTEFRKNELH